MKHRRSQRRILGLSSLRKQRGAVALEYLLLVAAVVALMAVGLWLGVASMVPQVVGLTCPGVDTAYDSGGGPYPAAPDFGEPTSFPPATVGECLDPPP